MSDGEPIATIHDFQSTGDIYHIKLELTTLPGLPIVPANLYLTDGSNELICELHKLVEQVGHQITCESFTNPPQIPLVGQTYLFRSGWFAHQLEAVTDTSRTWVYQEYPDDGDHDHCLLTWETIAAYAEQRAGYYSEGDWITVDAYNRYIRDDFLRLRRP